MTTSPNNRADGHRRSPLLMVLILFDVLSRVPPALIFPALTALGAIAAWSWRRPILQTGAGALTLLVIIADAVSLSLLPQRGRSFGPVTPPLLALALVRAALTLALGAAWPTWPALIVTAILQLTITAAQVYATWVEPFQLTVTPLQLISPKLNGRPALQVLHISDVHFEGWTPRERQLLEKVRELRPDLILMTGDYLNLSSIDDPASHAGARDLLDSLASLAPTYAIIGSPPVDRPHVIPRIFEGLPITWLLDETADLTLKGHNLRLIGLRCAQEREQDVPRLQRLLDDDASEHFTILLYHTPDLMPEAAEAGIDLYLAGHTHGGQLRLPLFGALVTSSAFWKRYEAGLYNERDTVLYVSRGMGMEGLGAPRARFLAPPEIGLWTIRGTDGQEVHAALGNRTVRLQEE
jgi:hypothetical protein